MLAVVVQPSLQLYWRTWDGNEEFTAIKLCFVCAVCAFSRVYSGSSRLLINPRRQKNNKKFFSFIGTLRSLPRRNELLELPVNYEKYVYNYCLEDTKSKHDSPPPPPPTALSHCHTPSTYILVKKRMIYTKTIFTSFHNSLPLSC